MSDCSSRPLSPDEIVDYMLSHGGTYMVGRDKNIYKVNFPEQVFKGAKTYVIPPVFDEEEVHPNCTVQVWRNSVTGEESWGWWENDPNNGNNDGIDGRDDEVG